MVGEKPPQMKLLGAIMRFGWKDRELQIKLSKT